MYEYVNTINNDDATTKEKKAGHRAHMMEHAENAHANVPPPPGPMLCVDPKTKRRRSNEETGMIKSERDGLNVGKQVGVQRRRRRPMENSEREGRVGVEKIFVVQQE